MNTKNSVSTILTTSFDNFADYLVYWLTVSSVVSLLLELRCVWNNLQKMYFLSAKPLLVHGTWDASTLVRCYETSILLRLGVNWWRSSFFFLSPIIVTAWDACSQYECHSLTVVELSWGYSSALNWKVCLTANNIMPQLASYPMRLFLVNNLLCRVTVLVMRMYSCIQWNRRPVSQVPAVGFVVHASFIKAATHFVISVIGTGIDGTTSEDVCVL